MTLWQADFYRRPLQDEAGNELWELVMCDETGGFNACALCPQAQVNSAWLIDQLQQMAVNGLPDKIQVFRPQSLSLLDVAGQALGIAIEPTRRTPALKQILQLRAAKYPTMAGYTGSPYAPIALDSPPPLPMPQELWGDQWRFAAIAAADLEPAFRDRPIPICQMPSDLLPVNQAIASTTMIPGVLIDGGRQSMRLAQWLRQVRPAWLHYIPGGPDGLILEAGLCDRWVLTTFDYPEVTQAAAIFRERQSLSQGLHFLLVQPDNSGMTYSGLWLLQDATDRQL